MKKYTIAVAGTGYVGMSIATLLAQHNHVIAVDILPEKVEKINRRISPIQDDYIERYLAEKELDLTRTENCDECQGSGCQAGTSAETCPTCGQMLFRKKGKALLVCHDKNCGYSREAEPMAEMPTEE